MTQTKLFGYRFERYRMWSSNADQSHVAKGFKTRSEAEIAMKKETDRIAESDSTFYRNEEIFEYVDN